VWVHHLITFFVGTNEETVSLPQGQKDLQVYVATEIFHSAGDQDKSTQKVACTISDEGLADAMLSEKLSFTFATEELVFVRLAVRRPMGLLKDEELAVFTARVDRLKSGWRVARLMDMKGKDSGATVLVRFDSRIDSAPTLTASLLNRVKALFISS
jgi:phosphatidylinositol phospholipase C delta